MKKIFVGKIIEKKINMRKIISYNVSLFNNKVKKTFYSSADAYNFVSKEMEKLLDLKKSNLAVIKYIKKDNREKFWTYENKVKNGENTLLIIEYTKFDFLEIYKHFFYRNININIINERNYSFYDICRLKTIIPKSIFYLMTSINILSLLSILAFLFFGIDMFFTVLNFPLNKKEQTMAIVSSATMFISNIAISILSWISCWRPLKFWEKEKKYDIFIDWKKEWEIKKRIKISGLVLAIISFVSFVIFFLNTIDKDFYSKNINNSSAEIHFIFLLSLFACFLLTFLLSLSHTLYVILWNKKMLNIFFSPKEILEYKKWMNGMTNNVIYKKNISFFELDFEKNNSNIIKKRMLQNKIEENYTKKQLFAQRNKKIKRNKIAIKKYLELMKE